MWDKKVETVREGEGIHGDTEPSSQSGTDTELSSTGTVRRERDGLLHGTGKSKFNIVWRSHFGRTKRGDIRV